MPFVDFVEFANFGVIEEKNSVDCRKHNIEKINYNHIVVNK